MENNVYSYRNIIRHVRNGVVNRRDFFFHTVQDCQKKEKFLTFKLFIRNFAGGGIFFRYNILNCTSRALAYLSMFSLLSRRPLQPATTGLVISRRRMCVNIENRHSVIGSL